MPAEVARHYVVQHRGRARFASWAWSPRVTGVEFNGEKVEVLSAEHRAHQADEHWQMELTVGGAQSGIRLTGWTPGNEPKRRTPMRMRPRQACATTRCRARALPRRLGNYPRRSEQKAGGSRASGARVTVGSVDGEAAIVNVHRARVRAGERVESV